MRRITLLIPIVTILLTALVPTAAARSPAIGYRGTTQQGESIKFHLIQRDGGELALRSMSLRFHAPCDDGKTRTGVYAWQYSPVIPLDGRALNYQGDPRLVGSFWSERAVGRIRVWLISFGPDSFVCRTPWLHWHAKTVSA